MTFSEDIADRLANQGWGLAERFFPAALTAVLRHDLTQDIMDDSWREAATGRDGLHAAVAPIRTDRTLWLTGATRAQADYLNLMEQLRLDLNRMLYLGLFDYECHYAVYQPGGFYKKHVDALRGARNRVVSCVTYLTENWRAEDAGELVLYDPATGGQNARILPQEGSLAFFLSEEIPHEVLPPLRARASIAGWFRCNPSGEGRVDPSG